MRLFGIDKALKFPMKKADLIAVLLLSAAPLLARSFPSGPQKPPEIGEKYELWLNDEVNYLITDDEKKLFLLLKTDREREAFISSFWARRDPVPLTAVNEFKEEHYRRLTEARAKYRIHSDRGRIYILLGPPDSIDDEMSGKYVFPCEIWNYFHLDIPSFPNSLRLLFFKQWGVGDFRLYSPLFDGLEYLVPQRHYDFREGDDAAIRKLLRDFVGPDFLLASESVAAGIDRLQSERVLGTLRNPQAFEGLRAAAGQPVVTTTVTYERLPFEVAGFFSDDGHGNAYYDASVAVSPENLTFEKRESKYYGRQDVYVTVRDAGKNRVAQFNDQLSLELGQEEMAAKKGYGLAYAFSELLVPGDYTLTVLLRDFVSNRVGEKEVKFSLPATPRSTPLLLAGRAEHLTPMDSRASGRAGTTGEFGKTPFMYGHVKILPRTNAAFRRDEPVILYFELYPRPGDSGQYNLRYSVRDNKGQTVMSSGEVLSVAVGEKVLPVEKTFSPKALADGVYSLHVAVSDAASGSGLFEQTGRFTVTSESRPPGTFSFEQPYHPSREEMYTELGIQSLYKKDLPAARQFFTLALSFSPGYVPAKIQLARCYVLEGNDAPALDLLLPLAEQGVENSELDTILGNIYYGRRDLDRAVLYLRKAADINLESVDILNFLAAVYLEKGEKEMARETFSRSLKIREDQPLVKAALDRLGK